MKWLLLPLGIAGVFSFSPIDPYLDASMTAQMVIEIPGLILLGVISGWIYPLKLTAPWAFACLIVSLGGVVFWMVPRSIDLAVSADQIDLWMHLCLLLAGFGISQSLFKLSLMIQIAVGIYVSAMWSSFALILQQSLAQVCARFTVTQQQEAGAAMLWVGALFFVIHLGISLVKLTRQGPI